MTADPARIVDLVRQFTGPDLTQTLARIEGAVRGVTASDCTSFLESAGAGRDALAAAAELKRFAGQINVTIHALGILLCLPHILEPDERVKRGVRLPTPWIALSHERQNCQCRCSQRIRT